MAVADDDVGVTVEAVADAAYGSHDVLVPAELRAKAAYVHIDRALSRHLAVIGTLPERGDQLRPLDRATFAQHEVLEKLEFRERERSRLAVDHDALARDVEDDATRGAVGVFGLGGGGGCGDGGGLTQRATYDIHVPTTRASGRERHCGIGLGIRCELGKRPAQGIDKDGERDAGSGCLGLIEPDIEGEAAGSARGRLFGDRGHGVQVAGRSGAGEEGGVRHGDDGPCGGPGWFGRCCCGDPRVGVERGSDGRALREG